MEYNLNNFVGRKRDDFLQLFRENIVLLYAGPRNEVTEKQVADLYAIWEFAYHEVFEKTPEGVFSVSDLRQFQKRPSPSF